MKKIFKDFNYKNYMNDEIKGFNFNQNIDEYIDSNNKELQITILMYLKKLGFNIKEEGTLLFMQTLSMLINEIREASKESPDALQNLYEQVEYPFSQFYFNIARNLHSMGVKSYHNLIRLSIMNINMKMCDNRLWNDIFGRLQDDAYWGTQIFALAKYIDKQQSLESTMKFNR